VFRGRPTRTVHLYDDEGRLARSITESPWSDEDRALMLAYRMWRHSICEGCGQPKRLAHHPDNDGWYEATPVVCHGCTAMRRKANEGSKEPVKPVEFYRLAHDRDYDLRPLPMMQPDQ
jgi:hypothetical protein